MVKCRVDKWEVEIAKAEDQPESYRKGIPTTRYVVSVKENDQTISRVDLLGYRSPTSPVRSSFVVDGSMIVVCVSEKVLCLEIPSLMLQWEVTADEASCFEIYSREEGYFVHGELTITKLTKSGEIEWQFLGRDIFVTPEGKDNFKLDDDRIVVRDWQGYSYTLDLNGKLIGDQPPAPEPK